VDSREGSKSASSARNGLIGSKREGLKAELKLVNKVHSSPLGISF